MITEFLLLLIASLSCQAATVVKGYDGDLFIENADIYKGSPVYVTNGTVRHKTTSAAVSISNVTDLSCSDVQGICIVAGDFLYHSYVIDASGMISKKDEYNVRVTSNLRIYSRVTFIEGTEYFLTSSMSKFGIGRFKVNQLDRYSKLVLDNIPTTLDTQSLLVIPRTKFGIVAYTSYKNLFVFDFTAMTLVNTLDVKAGFLEALDTDQSATRIVVAYEEKISKVNYMNGTIDGTASLDSLITGIRNVRGTDYVIVSSFDSFSIFNFQGNNSINWISNSAYYYQVGKNINDLKFYQKEGSILVAGLGHTTVVKDSNSAYCHPSCSGCTFMLTEYVCSTCAASSTMTNGACVPNSIQAPPSAALLSGSVTWSEDNVKPAESKGFNIKDYYLYIIIGAGGLVALCCLYCMFKICCGNSEEDEENQRNNQVRQRKEDD